MYHISNDKRAVNSAKKIGNGLLLCLQSKNFTEITVTDVQKASAVGRATFYRLFDNTVDVLTYLCDDIFEQADKKYTYLKTKNASETTLTFIRIWMQNKVLLKSIVNCNRTDLIFRSHVKYLAPRKEEFFPKSTPDNTQNTYLMATLTACTSAFLTSWLASGSEENAEQLQLRLKECFKALGEIFE